MKNSMLPIMACLFLGACTVGEDYQKPKMKFSDRWQALVAAQNHPAPPQGQAATADGMVQTNAVIVAQSPVASNAAWWERFRDPQLSHLMEKAKADNNDLKVALARIVEARGNARVADASQLPQLNASGSVGRTGALRNTATPPDTVKQIGISGSWDIDIFGGDSRSIEAALAEVQATQADHDRTLLTLVTDVATNYIQLRSLQQQARLTVRNLAMQNDTLKVTQGQRAEGSISDLEVSRAKAQVSGTEARLPQIDTATVAALNRLSVLTGEDPTTLNAALAAPQPIPFVPLDVVVDTPIAAIERRPDIQSSERRLAEATALSGAALSQLYPKISLQAFFGSQMSQVYGYSTPINATASVLMPLLDWGRLHGQIDAAKARQQEAFYTYQQTVLLALEQIENALTAYMNEQKRQGLLSAAAQEQGKAAEVAREQYKVGATTQLDLLTAENNQLDADNELTLSNAALATDLIQLYSVLGQTWQPEPDSATDKPAAQPVSAHEAKMEKALFEIGFNN